MIREPSSHGLQLRHITEVRPVVIHGARVFVNVYARGTDLVEMDAKEPGLFNGSRWISCDLDETVWPSTLRAVTILDSSLRNSIWKMDYAENIRIMSSVRINVQIT
jgi:hypothetical protein